MRLILAAAATLAMSVSAYGTETTVSYSLPSGTCSKPIAIPANLKPVALTAANIQVGDEGVGQVTILRQNKQPILIWTGTDNLHSSPVNGFGSSPGTPIMTIDHVGAVVVGIYPGLNLGVCNNPSNPGTAAGYLTFIY